MIKNGRGIYLLLTDTEENERGTVYGTGYGFAEAAKLAEEITDEELQAIYFLRIQKWQRNKLVWEISADAEDRNKYGEFIWDGEICF